MRRKDRYDTTDLDENQFEPGSRQRVLKNLLGITSKREMDRMEGRAQVRVLEVLAGFYDSDHRFTAADICRLHRLWLGRIYPWLQRKGVGSLFSPECPSLPLRVWRPSAGLIFKTVADPVSVC